MNLTPMFPDEFNALNDIYHSTSATEMRIKADLHQIKIDDPDNILYLIETTAYHHAFWPHTAKRFTAFKALLRSMKDLPRNPRFKDIKMVVENSIDEILNNKWKRDIPGGKQEMKNLQQVLKILEKLEKGCK